MFGIEMWGVALTVLTGLVVILPHSAFARVFDINRSNNVGLYWGQNSFGATHPGVPGQKAIEEYCSYDTSDIYLVSFLNIFNAGSDSPPGLNLANACETTFNDSSLLHCPDTGKGIKQCQEKGKIVLLSLGGAAGSYGFNNDEEAAQFADRIWDMFMGGKADRRPFEDAIIDGVDLDIEGGSSVGYSAFVHRLRERFAERPERKFYITAAPQCPFPDVYLGPIIDHSWLDMLFVQFYNNWCNAQYFPDRFNFDDWDKWAKTRSMNPDVKIYLGIPGSPQAAGTGYVDPEAISRIIPEIKNKYPTFGGVFMWDASQATQNRVGEKNYLDHINDILGQAVEQQVSEHHQEPETQPPHNEPEPKPETHHPHEEPEHKPETEASRKDETSSPVANPSLAPATPSQQGSTQEQPNQSLDSATAIEKAEPQTTSSSPISSISQNTDGSLISTPAGIPDTSSSSSDSPLSAAANSPTQSIHHSSISSSNEMSKTDDGGSNRIIPFSSSSPVSTPIKVVPQSSQEASSASVPVTIPPQSVAEPLVIGPENPSVKNNTGNLVMESMPPVGRTVCPVEGAECSDEGYTCNGHHFGTCVFGRWVMRKCSASPDVACFNVSPDLITCDWIKGRPLQTCDPASGSDNKSEAETQASSSRASQDEAPASVTEENSSSGNSTLDGTSSNGKPASISRLVGFARPVDHLAFVSEPSLMMLSRQATDFEMLWNLDPGLWNSPDGPRQAKMANNRVAGVAGRIQSPLQKILADGNKISGEDEIQVAPHVESNEITPMLAEFNFVPVSSNHEGTDMQVLLRVRTLSNNPIPASWRIGFELPKGYELRGTSRGQLIDPVDIEPDVKAIFSRRRARYRNVEEEENKEDPANQIQITTPLSNNGTESSPGNKLSVDQIVLEEFNQIQDLDGKVYEIRSIPELEPGSSMALSFQIHVVAEPLGVEMQMPDPFLAFITPY
ncbi:Chitinase 2 [Mycoemilia scoparia]|uniref:chitinase n=1 Tax=Mycoemilia scoparia TaxID=417184 RepID=A0A9W8A7L8_9FUNG|nr:Chitinase 2 [Mycoemilia scoparia]